MGKILITGSADGLGLLAAKALIDQGHEVVLHARNEKRSVEALKQAPGANTCLIGDLNNIEETKQLASKANSIGNFDVIIHNAGVYNASPKEILTVNVIAPYILTCLIKKPKRLIYLSSDMHFHGHPKLESLNLTDDKINYSDSKLLIVMLCKAVARKWTDVYVNAVDPGWVPTKMGGPGAPRELRKGYETQVWLATSNEEKVRVSGHYFFNNDIVDSNPEGNNIILQDELLKRCAELTGVR